MSSSSEAPPATSDANAEALFGELHKNWGWLLGAGILSIVLGTIGLGMCFGLTMASVLLFGVILAVSGVVELFQSFKCRGWKSFILHLSLIHI